MSDEQAFTDEDSEAASEVLQRVMPMIHIVSQLIEDEEAELLSRGMDEVAADISRKEAASIVYMAMGMDLERNQTFRNSRRNVPLVKAYLEMRRIALDNLAAEAVDAEKESEREAFRKRLGL